MRVGGVVPVETDRGKWQKQNGILQEGCEGEEMRRQEGEKIGDWWRGWLWEGDRLINECLCMSQRSKCQFNTPSKCFKLKWCLETPEGEQLRFWAPPHSHTHIFIPPVTFENTKIHSTKYWTVDEVLRVVSEHQQQQFSTSLTTNWTTGAES